MYKLKQVIIPIECNSYLPNTQSSFNTFFRLSRGVEFFI